MTVKELIEELQKYPGDANVVVSDRYKTFASLKIRVITERKHPVDCGSGTHWITLTV